MPEQTTMQNNEGPPAFRIPVEWTGGDAVLKCPLCHGINVHPVRLDCISPGQRKGRVTIDQRGVAIDPTHLPSGRGVRIELRFICENQHTFTYMLQFHQGSTIAEIEAHNTDSRECGDWTIWRD